VLAIWPRLDQQWAPAENGHIDGYGPNGWSGGFMLGATTYIDDVEPGGGAFSYWPKSHFPTHDFFLKDPSTIDGSFREGPVWEERQWRIFSDAAPSGPVEFTARAGSVIFWHCFMCHTGSTNVRSMPRFGMFSRWHHVDREAMRFDVAADLWKYWAI
jgi:ectoine hydroxylase-related dioxygenase (phytanoyl-CoA dioxygenase family)